MATVSNIRMSLAILLLINCFSKLGCSLIRVQLSTDVSKYAKEAINHIGVIKDTKNTVYYTESVWI